MVFLGADILSHHGAAGGGQRIGDHCGNGAQLIADPSHCGGHNTVGVDVRIYEQHGEVDGCGLQDHGKPQLYELGEYLGVWTKALQFEIKAKGFLVPVEIKNRP